VKIIPLKDKLIVEIVKDEAKGLEIAESGKEAPNKGRVCEIGETKTFKTGDLILFEKYAGNETTIDGREITILREEDVLVILKEDGVE